MHQLSVEVVRVCLKFVDSVVGSHSKERIGICVPSRLFWVTLCVFEDTEVTIPTARSCFSKLVFHSFLLILSYKKTVSPMAHMYRRSDLTYRPIENGSVHAAGHIPEDGKQCQWPRWLGLKDLTARIRVASDASSSMLNRY